MTQDDVKRLFIYEPETGMLRKRDSDNPYPFHPAGDGLRVTKNDRLTESTRLQQELAVKSSNVEMLEAEYDKLNARFKKQEVELGFARESYNDLKRANGKQHEEIIELHKNQAPQFISLYYDIADEVDRATSKHPNWPDDAVHAAAILAEETGELVRSANIFA